MSAIAQAVAIAASGLPVFPCGKTKKPAISKLKGGHGFLDSVTAEDEVRSLFDRAPHAMLVGVPTGERSGFDALDFDYRHGAADWERENLGRLPETRIHQTQHGGRHMLFRHAPGVRNLASSFAPGMDVRGDGGYVIYPPSTGYILIHDVALAEWPEWLLSIILKAKAIEDRPIRSAPSPEIASKRVAGLVESIIRRVSSAPEGGKHFALRNAALSLGGIAAAAGFSNAAGVEMLIAALPASVQDWAAAKQTALWGLEHGRERPLVLEDRPQYQRSNGTGLPHSDTPTARQNFDGLDTEEPLQAEERRVVRVLSGFRHVAADKGLAALDAAKVPFYQRDKSMVRAGIAKAKSADGSVVDVPSIVQVSIPMLARALGQASEWEKCKADGEVVRIDPPKEVVEQIASMFGHWPFPPISGVISTQTMRPDGSLLTEPGYDTATGLVLLSPPKLPPIPANPTKQDAEKALIVLDDLLVEFPFADKASHSTALSMIMTPVLRGALSPAVPMHMVAAPQAGTGKSYLQDLASAISTGERCAVITIAPEPAETEKRLIGAALAGYPIIALDNCNSVLTGDFLAQVTERPLMQLRALGGSGVVRVSNSFTVFANGNNISVSADLVRRTLLCTLDANMENPETRTFTTNPLASILANRGKYIAACLTIARAYVCAGMPSKLPRIPSFEQWSDLVRSALVWLGWADPNEGTEAIRADDPTRNQRAAIFEAWAETLQVGTGYLVKELIDTAEEYDSGVGKFVNADWRNALMEVAKSKASDRVDGKKLGWWLHSKAKVVSGKFKLMVDRANPTRPRWSLHEI